MVTWLGTWRTSERRKRATKCKIIDCLWTPLIFQWVQVVQRNARTEFSRDNFRLGSKVFPDRSFPVDLATLFIVGGRRRGRAVKAEYPSECAAGSRRFASARKRLDIPRIKNFPIRYEICVSSFPVSDKSDRGVAAFFTLPRQRQ